MNIWLLTWNFIGNSNQFAVRAYFDERRANEDLFLLRSQSTDKDYSVIKIEIIGQPDGLFHPAEIMT